MKLRSYCFFLTPVLSALLACCCSFDLIWGNFIFVSLVPLMWAFNKRPIFSTLVFSFFYEGISLFWLTDVGWSAFIFLAIYHSFYLIVFSWVQKYLKFWLSKLALLAILWWFKENIACGSSLDSFSLSLSSSLAMMQLSSIGGSLFIDVFIVFFNGVFFYGFFLKESKNIFAGLALLLFISYWGEYRIQKFEKNSDKSELIRIRLIQPNFSPYEKWHSIREHEQIEKMIDLSLKNKISDINLVVWPETAIVDDIRRNPELMLFLKKKLVVINRPLLFGGHDLLSHKSKMYNAAFMLSSSDMEIYHKKLLIPFGEFIPFRKQLPFLGKLSPINFDFSKAESYQSLNLNNSVITPFICFEDTNSSYVRKHCKDSNRHLALTISNDGWFHSKKASLIHHQLSRYRSIENGIGFVRCSNTGLTSNINFFGRVENVLLDKNNDFRFQGILDVEVSTKRTLTVYSLIGSHWISFLALLSLFLEIFKNGILGRFRLHHRIA